MCHLHPSVQSFHRVGAVQFYNHIYGLWWEVLRCCGRLAGPAGLLGLGGCLTKQRGVPGVSVCVSGVQGSAGSVRLVRLCSVGLHVNTRPIGPGGAGVGVHKRCRVTLEASLKRVRVPLF